MCSSTAFECAGNANRHVREKAIGVITDQHDGNRHTSRASVQQQKKAGRCACRLLLSMATACAFLSAVCASSCTAGKSSGAKEGYGLRSAVTSLRSRQACSVSLRASHKVCAHAEQGWSQSAQLKSLHTYYMTASLKHLLAQAASYTAG